MILRYIEILCLVVIFKGCLSAAEIALKTDSRRKLISQFGDEDEKNGFKGLDADKYVITINVLKSILIIVLGGFIFNNIGSVINEIAFIDSSNEYFVIFAEAVVLALTIYILVIFGSFIPKKVALKKPDKVISIFMFPIKLIYIVFFFFFKPLTVLSSYLSNILGVNKSIYEDDVTQEEILMLVDAGGETGTIDEDEIEMINNVFDFDDKTAGDIATHRKDIVAVSIDSDIEDVVNIVLNEKYSRIPVYKDSIDNIVGIIHIKDVMKNLILFGRNDFDFKNLIMEPFFVPFTKKTDELFKEMQENKIHLCVVLDEYGGTLGIVSMEDLIEEIMGNILDEYDDEELPEIITDDGINFYIDGTTNIEDVCDYLKINLSKDEEYDTMSGFFIGQMGKIPDEKNKEDFQFETEGYLFKAEKTEGKRISMVRAVKIEKEPVLQSENNLT